MNLKLTITSYQKNALGLDSSRVFDKDGGKIGRRADCDWVISDPDKILSGCHVEVNWESDGFVVKDTSTNGLFVNGSSTPLGRGNVAQLSDGDTLRIGEYDLQVSIADPLVSSADTTGITETHERESTDVPNRGFDPLAGLSEEVRSKPMESETNAEFDHSEALSDPFELPSASLDGDLKSSTADLGGIPEDWDMDADDGFTEDGSAEDLVQEPTKDSESPLEIVDSSPNRTGDLTPPMEAKEQRVIDVDEGAGTEDVSAKSLENETDLLLLQGLMDLLAARTRLKNEFRLEMTTVKPSENNPLKFSANARDALELFSQSSSSAYLPFDKAVSEGLDDIKNHQFAMIAAMKVAFERLMDQFNPARFQDDVSKKKSRLASVALGQDRQNWQRYERFFKEMIADSDDPFQELFGREFAAAYEDFALRASLNISGESDQ